MNRKVMRDIVFKMLFSCQFNTIDDPSDIYERVLQENKVKEDDLLEDPYINNVFFGIMANREKIDEMISQNSNGWKINRISNVSQCALRISTYEMMYMKDVPAPVSINEALEIIKKYDDPKAAKFDNGILNTIAKSLEKDKENDK